MSDHGPEYRHVDDMPWETLRFPGQQSKMVFHPNPARPSEPNTGFVHYTGPTTGQGPIYDGRFNMKERKPLSEENLEV